MDHPSWFEHVDLMQVLIAALIILIAWYEKKDRRRLSEDAKDIWERVNHHSHEIECNKNDCKPKCGKVLIVD